MNVYLEAAKKVHAGKHGGYTCHCIGAALGLDNIDKDHPTKKKYEKLFRPDAGGDTYSWLVGWFDSDRERRQWRLTALCLAAAMHDAGDL